MQAKAGQSSTAQNTCLIKNTDIGPSSITSTGWLLTSVLKYQPKLTSVILVEVSVHQFGLVPACERGRRCAIVCGLLN